MPEPLNLSALPPDLWQRVSELFDEVIELPETERIPYIRKLWLNEPDVARELMALLVAMCVGVALAALLAWAGHTPTSAFDPAVRREADLDRLADAVEEHMDLAKLERWLPGISG